MKIIKNEGPVFNLCLCNGHDISMYTEKAWRCLSIDNKDIVNLNYFLGNEIVIQLPYTQKEYDSEEFFKYKCPKCNRIPFRIIRKEKR